MKKIIIGIITIAVAFAGALAPMAPVFAQDACEITGNSDPLVCGDRKSDEERALMERIRNILETVYLWIGIIAAVVIVIGGIFYMISIGDAAKIQRAKSAILYAVIGLIVTLAAFAITNLVINALEGKH